MEDSKVLNIEKDKKSVHKPKINFLNTLQYVFFIIITAIVIIPLLITLFAAFKTPIEVGSHSPLKLPNSLYLKNFITVFKKGHILLGFKNTMTLVLVTVVINSILATMVSYCLTRFDFRFKKILLGVFLLGMIVPGIVTEIARFGIIKNLGLYNTIYAPMVIYAGTDLMQIYIYMQYMNQIPKSLDESAMIDGCSYFGIYWKIIFPVVIPATATLAILKIVTVMNDMYIPYLYMPSSKLRTLTTTLMAFNGTRTGSIVELSAAVIVVMIPTILLFLLFQKYVFKGIVAGAVKE